MVITFVSVFSIKYVVWSVSQLLLFCFALFFFLFAVALGHCLQLCLAAVLIMSYLAENFCLFNLCLNVKPWPNGVTSGHKLITWVYLRLRLVRACVHLR